MRTIFKNMGADIIVDLAEEFATELNDYFIRENYRNLSVSYGGMMKDGRHRIEIRSSLIDSIVPLPSWCTASPDPDTFWRHRGPNDSTGHLPDFIHLSTPDCRGTFIPNIYTRSLIGYPDTVNTLDLSDSLVRDFEGSDIVGVADGISIKNHRMRSLKGMPRPFANATLRIQGSGVRSEMLKDLTWGWGYYDLSGNELDSCPDISYEDGTNIYYINLSNNRIQTLDRRVIPASASAGEIPFILDVTGNPLESISDGFVKGIIDATDELQKGGVMEKRITIVADRGHHDMFGEIMRYAVEGKINIKDSSHR